MGVHSIFRLSSTGDAIESETAIREIMTVLERHVAAGPDKPQYRSALAVVHHSLGALLYSNHRFVDAEQGYRTAVDLLDNLATSPPDPRDQAWMVNSHGGLALTLSASGRPREAESVYHKLFELKPDHAPALNNLAWLVATCPEVAVRDPSRALELAKRAAELAPKELRARLRGMGSGGARISHHVWCDRRESLDLQG